MLKLTLDSMTLEPVGKEQSPFGISCFERISKMRHELYMAGFGVETTVANCGVPLPAGLCYVLDNDQERFLKELRDKGISVSSTAYAYTFTKEKAWRAFTQ